MSSWPSAFAAPHLNDAAPPSARRALGAWPAQALLIAVIVGAQTLSAAVVVLTFVGLGAWALRGPRPAIQSLSLVWILGLLNPDLLAPDVRFDWPSEQTLLRLKWGVLLAAATSCFAHTVLRREAVPRPVLWITLFAAITCLASLATSELPDVSISKLVSFWLGATTLLLGFHRTRAEFRQHHDWFTALAAALVALSLPLLLVPGMYRFHDHLFRGLFSHPQFTGLVFATIVAWMAGRCLADRLLSATPLLLGAGAFAVLWPTGSRTAVFAIGLAFFVALGLRWLVARTTLQECATVVFRPRIAALFFLVLMTVVASGDSIADQWSQFVQKRQPGAVLGASTELWSTREYMVRTQWANFQRRPWFGNGFGVPSRSGLTRVVRDPVTGIALSSATEKGFLPTAVLEETGVVGAGLLVIALAALYGWIMKASLFPRAWLAVTALLVNFGESVFFSFGGVGMFLWLMIGFATVPERGPESPEQS